MGTDVDVGAADGTCRCVVGGAIDDTGVEGETGGSVPASARASEAAGAAEGGSLCSQLSNRLTTKPKWWLRPQVAAFCWSGSAECWATYTPRETDT